MAEKDKSYDPLIEYESEAEREEREMYTTNNMDHSQGLNNKLYSPSYSGSLVDAFVLNDISEAGEECDAGGGWRRGGPLMNPPPNNQRAQPPRRCVNCDQLTNVWHSGERFECDEWYADEPEELEAHNQLCTSCATSEEDCPGCPVHPNSYYKSNVDTNQEPAVVWRAD